MRVSLHEDRTQVQKLFPEIVGMQMGHEKYRKENRKEKGGKSYDEFVIVKCAAGAIRQNTLQRAIIVGLCKIIVIVLIIGQDDEILANLRYRLRRCSRCGSS